jgi:hypothetical protein
LHDSSDLRDASVSDHGRGKWLHWDRRLSLPRYKVGWRFGKQVAVPTRYNHTPPHSKKQRKRRVAKRKKYGHKTGRYPKR